MAGFQQILKALLKVLLVSFILIECAFADWDDYLYSEEVVFTPCTQDVQCFVRCPRRGYLFGCNPLSEIRCSLTQQRPHFYNDWYACGELGVGSTRCSCPDNRLYVRSSQQSAQVELTAGGEGGLNGYQGGPCSFDQECEAKIGNGGFCKKDGGRFGVCICRFASHWYHGGMSKCIPFATQVGDFCMNDGHCRFVGPSVTCNQRNNQCYYQCGPNENCLRDVNQDPGYGSGGESIKKGFTQNWIILMATVIVVKQFT